MTGITDLSELLKSMSPLMLPEPYVFCFIKDAQYGELAELNPVATFQEAEGLTLVVTKSRADQVPLNYDTVFRCITLQVCSSLEAVGLTAAVATKLTEYGISANVIAAYYHDHIFVPADKAELAIQALSELRQQ